MARAEVFHSTAVPASISLREEVREEQSLGEKKSGMKARCGKASSESSAQAGPSEDAVGEAEKTKDGAMGVTGEEYFLSRKKGGFPGLCLIALASPLERTFSKKLWGHQTIIKVLVWFM